MIRAVEGIEHEEFIKDMCKLMFIGDEHNINFYINKDIKEECIMQKNKLIEIYLKEDKMIKTSIIYILQKYRFLCIVNKENKNPLILELMNCYLANYYAFMLFKDTFECIDNDILKKHLSGLKDDTIKICCEAMEDIYKQLENVEDMNETVILIGKILACKNILKKYNYNNHKFVKESFALSSILEELTFMNINEKYSEIEQAYNAM